MKRWTGSISAAVFVVLLLVSVGSSLAQAQDLPMDRTVLPIAEPTYPPITQLDVRKATAPPLFQVKAPQGAPNVIVILLDNLGFGATKPFGGVMNMPTLERLAENGLIYVNFHTAPLCSPSRVALITGRNPHSANMGSVAELSTAFTGNTSARPNSIAALPEIMKLNGYSTAMFDPLAFAESLGLISPKRYTDSEGQVDTNSVDPVKVCRGAGSLGSE
jgi:hypothetical protein